MAAPRSIQSNPAHYAADEVIKLTNLRNETENIEKKMEDRTDPNHCFLKTCCCIFFPVCCYIMIKNAWCPSLSNSERDALVRLSQTLEKIGKTVEPQSALFQPAKGPGAVVAAIENFLQLDHITKEKRYRLGALKAEIASLYGVTLSCSSEEKQITVPSP